MSKARTFQSGANRRAEKGDGVVIIRGDGTVSFFLVEIDTNAISEAAQKGELTQEQVDQWDVVNTTMSLAAAACSQTLMDKIAEFTDQPDFVNSVLGGNPVN